MGEHVKERMGDLRERERDVNGLGQAANGREFLSDHRGCESPNFTLRNFYDIL